MRGAVEFVAGGRAAIWPRRVARDGAINAPSAALNVLTGLIVAAPEPPGQQVRTRENIDRLHSEAAFAALCGASPLPVSTGRATATASTTAATATPTALHAIAVRRLRYCQRTRACA